MGKNNSKSVVEPRINGEIHGHDKVRLIYDGDADGQNSFNKVVSIEEARKIGERMELDLIEINGKASPAIVKLANYSKYLYELKKQQKQKNKQASANVVKEVQLSTNISEHDLSIKANKAMDFIRDGNKVKVVLTMRGRELGRREESKKCLYQLITMTEEVAVPESMPRDEGNKSTVILKRKQ